MQISHAKQLIAAAAVTLVCWIIGVACFLPPLNQHTLQSVLLMISAGIGLILFEWFSENEATA